MRLFQNASVYPSYLHRFHERTWNSTSFEATLSSFFADRYGAIHLLQPVLERNQSAFFTNGDDELLQRQWARENGLSEKAALDTILLAQIEHHRTEVFYNLDPVRYPSRFIARLPNCVKHKIAWRAAPSKAADLSAYDLVVSNFPSILKGYARLGWRTADFTPAHDPIMNQYAKIEERPVDILFVGGYSRHHQKRAELLEAVSKMDKSICIRFHLDSSRLTHLAESWFGRMLPIDQHRRPASIRAIGMDPIFGLDLYDALSKAKIVLNGAIDMAGPDRGNIRCFEAMGCGSLLLSDEGVYPQGMIPGINLVTWHNPADAVRRIHELLADDASRSALARSGHDMVSHSYSKQSQWQKFKQLIS
jgi:hypothetical protein